jgi:hypothetical protein
MHASKSDTESGWVDPDDAPELTDAMLEIAQCSIGGTVIRPATGTLGPNGVVRGRPPIGDADRDWGRAAADGALCPPTCSTRFANGAAGVDHVALRKAVGLCGARKLRANAFTKFALGIHQPFQSAAILRDS